MRDAPAPRSVCAGPPRSAGLPTAEPGARTLADQRDELLGQIDELEGTLRFMGATHPRRPETELHLTQLRDLVRRIDEAMAAQR